MRYERNGRSIKAYFPRGRNEIHTETNAVEAHLTYELLIEARKTNVLLAEMVRQGKPIEKILEPKTSKKKNEKKTSDKTRKNEKEKS